MQVIELPVSTCWCKFIVKETFFSGSKPSFCTKFTPLFLNLVLNTKYVEYNKNILLMCHIFLKGKLIQQFFHFRFIPKLLLDN